jgi:hypothetical protein
MKNSLNVVVSAPIDVWPYSYPDNPKSSILQFVGPDNEELYQRNLKNLSQDWIYRTKPVNYSFNSNKLRMKKDIKDVGDSYILFSGTSYTMGVGIDEESRFSEKVSEQAGLDFINFSGPTYSIKVQAISFFNLLKTNYKLPKVLVMEYAPEIGYTFYNNGNFVCTNTPFLKHLEGHDKITNVYKSLLDTDFFIQEATLYRNMLIGTCKRLGIKFVELSFNTTDQFVIDNNIMAIDSEYKGHNISMELARDVRLHDGNYSAHPGTSIHQGISSQILKLL